VSGVALNCDSTLRAPLVARPVAVAVAVAVPVVPRRGCVEHGRVWVPRSALAARRLGRDGGGASGPPTPSNRPSPRPESTSASVPGMGGGESITTTSAIDSRDARSSGTRVAPMRSDGFGGISPEASTWIGVTPSATATGVSASENGPASTSNRRRARIRGRRTDRRAGVGGRGRPAPPADPRVPGRWGRHDRPRRSRVGAEDHRPGDGADWPELITADNVVDIALDDQCLQFANDERARDVFLGGQGHRARRAVAHPEGEHRVPSYDRGGHAPPRRVRAFRIDREATSSGRRRGADRHAGTATR
jgi:hypothetical protein